MAVHGLPPRAEVGLTLCWALAGPDRGEPTREGALRTQRSTPPPTGRLPCEASWEVRRAAYVSTGTPPPRGSTASTPGTVDELPQRCPHGVVARRVRLRAAQ